MQVICLEEPAFYELIDTVIAYIKTKHEVKEDKWISGEEAMKLLHITSKTSLLKSRDEGRIRCFQEYSLRRLPELTHSVSRCKVPAGL
jgi:hypothetical protein